MKNTLINTGISSGYVTVNNALKMKKKNVFSYWFFFYFADFSPQKKVKKKKKNSKEICKITNGISGQRINGETFQ